MKYAGQIVILFMFLIFSSDLISQHGIDSDWKQNVQKIPKFDENLNASGAVANNMVVDKQGKVLVFYTEEIGNQLIHYYTGSTDDGLTWNNPSPTAFGPSASTMSNSTISADIDTNDIIHLIWSSRISKSVYYSHANSTNFSWSTPLIIGTTDKNKIGFCQISTDRKLRLHVYWNEGGPGSTDTSEVFYTQSVDGGLSWSNQGMLSEGENKHSAFPSGDFYGATGDTLAIAWRDSIGVGTSVQDWDIKMVTSTNGGLNWSNPFTIAGGIGMQSDPSIVIDRNGIIHLAYHEYPITGGLLSSKVYYGYSTDLGSTWNTGSFIQISEPSIQSHLVKEAYDFENNIVWYFYKDQRDYQSPFDKRADIIAVNIQNGGQTISSGEFISDADSNEVGFHNFKIGRDGIPRAHFFIIPYGTDSTSLFYTQRNSLSGVEEYKSEENVPFFFPNPTTGSVSINNTDSIENITIFDFSGHEIDMFYENNFSIKHLENGIYFIQVKTKTGISTYKIIKIS